ncbi:hypothetical protein RF11_00456 [Thelohanellus kitauei]|uniref:Uncharacterized protein n=1 Tax=Thelohanellus kitauei TaxID=669202 RepID=A0A0C2MJ27_THEKT|nr:hypothetical protein RF11_00456 [Thelohanellus kitauei]
MSGLAPVTSRVQGFRYTPYPELTRPYKKRIRNYSLRITTMAFNGYVIVFFLCFQFQNVLLDVQVSHLPPRFFGVGGTKGIYSEEAGAQSGPSLKEILASASLPTSTEEVKEMTESLGSAGAGMLSEHRPLTRTIAIKGPSEQTGPYGETTDLPESSEYGKPSGHRPLARTIAIKAPSEQTGPYGETTDLPESSEYGKPSGHRPLARTIAIKAPSEQTGPYGETTDLPESSEYGKPSGHRPLARTIAIKAPSEQTGPYGETTDLPESSEYGKPSGHRPLARTYPIYSGASPSETQERMTMTAMGG